MEAKDIKTDRRVIRTRRAIRNAFMTLIEQKDINDLTVKDIADMADINRKTFYNHYAGIYQIVDEIEDEIVSIVAGALENVDFTDVLINPYPLFLRLADGINHNVDFYSRIFKNDSTGFTKKIVLALKLKVKETFAAQIPIEPELFDIMAEYAMAGMVSVYQAWFRSDRTLPLDKLSMLTGRMTISGAAGLVQTLSAQSD